MSNDISKIGAAAIAALKALKAAKANKKSKTAKANELIEERNETARPLLQQVHDAIAAGQSVNGQSTWNGWAKQAGWSKRALNYILNGRKPQGGNSSSRSSFLTRIAEAKQKVGDIRRAYDAPFKPGEVKDSRVLDQIDPIIAPVFAEFCKLISPDGYKADFNGRHWFVNEDAFADEVSVTHLVHGNKTWCGFSPKDIGSLQLDQNGEYDCADCRKAKEQSKPITHIRVSPRKALCQTRFVNRKIKGAVYAKNGEEVTCPDCVAIRDKTISSKGTLQEARERLLAKNKKKTHALGTVLNDEIQWTICGKTIHTAEPGEIVIADDDKKPTCKTCLNHRKYRFGKQARKNRAEQVEQKQGQVTVMLKDDCEEHTGQHENCKECMRRHIPTDEQRKQSELFNACGNLDGDDEAETEGIAPEVLDSIKRQKNWNAVGLDRFISHKEEDEEL
jgi:hypothetical protein